jgi:hypothetical protein
VEHVTTRRRLVKSPPELWAEVSDPAALARRLAELGEIRITRTLPETTVAWEGERATGIVEIEAAGWGTRVSLSAVPAPGPEPAPAPPPRLPPPTRVETEARVVAEESIRVEIPAPAPEPEPEPPPVEEARPEPAPRPGFFARLFGRPEEPVAPTEPPPEPPEPTPPPPPPPEVLELRIVQAVCASRVPERPAPEPPPAPAPAIDAPELKDVLERALDDLGAAHHRPFSRA